MAKHSGVYVSKPAGEKVMNDGGKVVNEPAGGSGIVPESGADGAARYYKKDFWSEESRTYSQPHYRLEKSARIVNRLARGRECTLLDVGCGPATLMRLITPNIQYHGIDIVIHNPAPTLMEEDLLENPIRFSDKRFDLIVAQGFFEYAGDFQAQKFAEIATLLNENGIFIVSYENFSHRHARIYWPYNNVQAIDDFRQSLSNHFKISRILPTSHNWNHSEPHRKLVKAVNMHMNMNIPFVTPMLAVEYFFICSSRGS
jgi:SAM-dependent methyltransferase